MVAGPTGGGLLDPQVDVDHWRAAATVKDRAEEGLQIKGAGLRIKGLGEHLQGLDRAYAEVEEVAALAAVGDEVEPVGVEVEEEGLDDPLALRSPLGGEVGQADEATLERRLVQALLEVRADLRLQEGALKDLGQASEAAIAALPVEEVDLGERIADRRRVGRTVDRAPDRPLAQEEPEQLLGGEADARRSGAADKLVVDVDAAALLGDREDREAEDVAGDRLEGDAELLGELAPAPSTAGEAAQDRPLAKQLVPSRHVLALRSSANPTPRGALERGGRRPGGGG